MSDDAELIKMRAKWSGGWSIWRARRAGDVGDERTGGYVASRMHSAAGADPTVMDASLPGLDGRLEAQAEAARTGKRSPEIAGKWGHQ